MHTLSDRNKFSDKFYQQVLLRLDLLLTSKCHLDAGDDQNPAKNVDQPVKGFQ